MPTKNPDRKQGPTTQWLLGLIEDFLTINELDNDGNYFGWALCQDRTLVQRLRDGGDINVTRMDQALTFMQDPMKHHRLSRTGGVMRIKPLKPLNIEPKELP